MLVLEDYMQYFLNYEQVRVLLPLPFCLNCTQNDIKSSFFQSTRKFELVLSQLFHQFLGFIGYIFNDKRLFYESYLMKFSYFS